MKRNQLSAIANIRRKVTNGAPLSIDEIIKVCSQYVQDCGLSFKLWLNHWCNGIVQTAIIDLFDDDDMFNGKTIFCHYITDDVHLSDYGIKSASDLPDDVGKRWYQMGDKQAWDCPIANGCRVLVSYSTVIGVYNPADNTLYLQPQAYQYSNTTSRHISAFIERVDAKFIKFVDF